MTILYLVEYLGDIAGGNIGKYGENPQSNADGFVFESLEAALKAIAIDFPLEEILDWETNQPTGQYHRIGPDPEDDRILIWEILPSKHRKVVWHFSGWHWDSSEFSIEQGSLPGDKESLYGMVME